MAGKKIYRVYSVIERPNQDDFWLNLGIAVRHEKGDGFNLVLQALPLNGRLVLRAYDPSKASPPEGRSDDETGHSDQ